MLAVLVRMVGHVLTMVMATTAIVLLVYLTTSVLTVPVSAQSKLHTVARRLYLQHCNLSTSVPSSLQAHRVCTINVRMALALLAMDRPHAAVSQATLGTSASFWRQS